MSKNNPEGYSRENYENTENALQSISSAIDGAHNAYTELAKPHLELMQEQGEGEYPFQSEFNALVTGEEEVTSPLIKKSLEFEKKLKRLHSLAWDEALETEKTRAYRKEFLPQVEAFNGSIAELEQEVARINNLIRDGRETGYKLEELLKKDHTTKEEDAEIAEYFATISELIPKIKELKHRLVHSTPAERE